MSLCCGAPVWVLAPNASPFWKGLVARYGITASLEGRTDDDTEAFFCEGFPYDIPDEWSIAERAKSHGVALGAGPSASPYAIYLHRHRETLLL